MNWNSNAETPSGAEFASTHDGNGLWIWTWSATPAKGLQVFDITVTATTGYGDSVEDSFTLTVNNVPPEIVTVAAPQEPVLVNTEMEIHVVFTDPGMEDVHTATVHWGDGEVTAVTSAEILFPQGTTGSFSASHVYTDAGVYTLTVIVTDDDGDSGSFVYEYAVVCDPSAGFVSGGGWILSPRGAYAVDPDLEGRATFGFVSRYYRGRSEPDGNTQFQFRSADLHFHSTGYEWLVISGARAQFKGTGTINGTGDFGFLLTAIDGDLLGGSQTDRFRIKIWDKATGENVYDNQMGASDTEDPTTELGGGSIVIQLSNGTGRR